MELKRPVFIFVLICLILSTASCNKSSDFCPLDLYSERYNAIAEKFGFSGSVITSSETGVCGFAAFDGLFIVCLCTTEDNLIYTADISTGSSYGALIKDNQEELERAALSAAYLVTPLYMEESDEGDISTLAGMILAAIEGDNIELGGDIVMTGKKNAAGGFEVTVSLMG